MYWSTEFRGYAGRTFSFIVAGCMKETDGGKMATTYGAGAEISFRGKVMTTNGKDNESRARTGIPTGVRQVSAFIGHLFYERTILVLSLLFAFGIALVLLLISSLQSNLVESTALRNAELYSQALTEFRTLYTSEVVERLASAGIEVTHDYETKEGAIPLPATLSMKLGRNIGNYRSGANSQLYSPFPFPWRKHLQDAFGRVPDFFNLVFEVGCQLKQLTAAVFAVIANLHRQPMQFQQIDANPWRFKIRTVD